MCKHARLCQSLVEAIKLRNRSCWWYRCVSMMTRLLRICSTVLRPGLKPACSSASSFSALALSRLRITWSMILLGCLIRLMVWGRLFFFLYFCGKGITSDCVHFFDHSFVSQIFWQDCYCCLASILKQLRGNDVNSWRLFFIASSTSSFSIGRLSASCVGVWLLWSSLVSWWSS